MEKKQKEKTRAFVDGEAQPERDPKADKEEIRRELQPYVDEGLLREIGSTEHVIAYNVCDKHYVIVTTGVRDQGYLVGVGVYPKVMKRILKNEEFLAKYLEALGSNLNRTTMYVGPTNLELMRKWKRETDEQGPSGEIDVQFEQKLGVRPVEEGAQPPKKRFLFFGRK